MLNDYQLKELRKKAERGELAADDPHWVEVLKQAGSDEKHGNTKEYILNETKGPIAGASFKLF